MIEPKRYTEPHPLYRGAFLLLGFLCGLSLVGNALLINMAESALVAKRDAEFMAGVHQATAARNRLGWESCKKANLGIVETAVRLDKIAKRCKSLYPS